MLLRYSGNAKNEFGPLWRGAKYIEDNPGLVGSLFLHGLAALLIFWLLKSNAQLLQGKTTRFVPVDVVQLGDETTSPPALQRARVPEQNASRSAPANPTREGVAPPKKQPYGDELQSKLKQLAKLRQPDAPLGQLDNSAQSDLDATSDGATPGPQASYSVRDFLRAQVERRWSLDVGALRTHNVAILLHVVVTPDGVVTNADIVDKGRYSTDKAYREIALSARNAVLLSSPIALPAGRFKKNIDVTLNLNPRDVLR